MTEIEIEVTNFAQLGAELAKHREEAELTVEQMAQLLRIDKSVVMAVEAGDESRLPTRVFVLGYISSYIRALDLPEADFAERIAAIFPPRPETSTAQRIDGGVNKLDIFEDDRATKTWFKWLMIVLVVSALIAALAYFFLKPTNSISELATQSAPVPTAELDVIEVSNAVDQPVSVPDEIIEEETQVDEGPLIETVMAEPVVVAAPEDSRVEEVVDTPVEAAPIQVRDTVVGTEGDRLELTFTGECWVEIKTDDGTLLAADLFNASRRLIVNTDQRVSVLLGYAPSARVMFKGDMVNFNVRDNAAAFFYVGE